MTAGNLKTICLFGKTIEVKVDDDPMDVEVELRDDEKEKEVKDVAEEARGEREQGGMKRYVPFFETRKFLTESDSSLEEGRVLVPDSFELYNALTVEEKDAVLKQGITVFAADNKRMVYRLNLCKCRKRNKLMINRGWNDVIRRNKLKPNDEMQLLGIRDNGNVRFGLIFNHGIKNNRVHKLLPSKETSQLAY